MDFIWFVIIVCERKTNFADISSKKKIMDKIYTCICYIHVDVFK